ncbi:MULTISPECIES: hypothetical protein [Acinetobacter calcoaceticus/baumannii complex]|uniref:hypothetical protein n=1 Tax=Acinetobacter calcoaceticus/baumannii complex TaxID=909768 RepID=UPI000BF460D1|nr:hypothetical protein [Acinetobacter baumannii]EHU1557185.1 hypothetical protein [Acinetobacter baumannii]MDC4578977.1 hypothetical protein [Acinetobacter baumannii]MDC4661936.1 hypothetical protein [Acinetobacter baumannii]MDC4675720.1 hypothetical protein [Acinetobacter baumannii]MDC4702288.1 hypothetical protein [Acinetobacter baumannii]
MSKLEKVLSFKNEYLVKQFSKKNNISLEDSEFLFIELKRLLWFFANRSNGEFSFPIFTDQKILDLYWHEFILSTKSYFSFCEENFGRYIHHSPDITYDELSQKDKDHYGSNILKECIREVYNIMGEDIVFRWFVVIPKKFDLGRTNDN